MAFGPVGERRGRMVDSGVTRHHRTGPSAPRPRLVTDTAGSRCGDHLCWAYHHHGAWLAVAQAFLAEGTALGERVLFAGSCPLPGAATLVPITTAGDLDAAWLAEMADAAVSAGFTGLRAVIDISSLLTTDREVDRHLSREVALDRAVATHSMALLCGFDASRVPRLAALARAHPLTNVEGTATASGFWFVDRGWTLTGEIDLAVAPELRIALLTALTAADGDLRIDCSSVTFLSVSGAEMLAEVADATRSDQRVVIENAPRAVRRVIEIGWPAGIPGLVLD
jgi:anti-anti-sigma factor